MSPIATASNGTVSATVIQKRRLMLRSSGFASSCVVTVRGSSVMPQIGQLPGPGRTISGCIGQVYSVRLTGNTLSLSSAIPQLGQGTGFDSRTSGHIGQT